jgi:hypothetical protein
MSDEPWTPFERAAIPREEIELTAKSFGLDPRTLHDGAEVYLNNVYQVAVYRLDTPAPGWPRMVHLSIKRITKEPCHDWRHFQWIKNELVGPEHEAVELYPAESRLTDSANQYHLYVIAEPFVRFPFGFATRLVSEDEIGKCRQRKFPDWRKPKECQRGQ